jgi:membrane-bound ClpP family serine protease
MPNWNDILSDIQADTQGPHDRIRRKYLTQIQAHTGRTVIAYYSGWLQKPGLKSNPAMEFGITDSDKTGFMTCSHEVDHKQGLDLILHTPGGDVAATESIIDYVQALYGGDIRTIIPQLAMSGGTLMALSSQAIVMGMHSSIGPIDPQIGNMPAQGILEEFERAAKEVKNDPMRLGLWQPIVAKYWPTLITSSRHAIDWSDQLLRSYLTQGMFRNDKPAVRRGKIQKIANHLGKQKTSKSHNRHINPDVAEKLGLNIVRMEADPALQDLVLSLHHAFTLTLTQTAAIKIIENHKGVAYVNMQMQIR